jgi:hypothetical protein
MKSWLWNGMLAAAIALPALSGATWAQRTDDDGCSNATLKGDYAFAVTDSTNGSFVVGIAQFDGKGNLTQMDYPANGLLMTPPLTDFRMGQTGTYAVGKDCAGTAVIDLNVGGMGTGHGVINLVFVIANGGRAIHAVVSGATAPFASSPSNNLTRSDFWKVGSEQDN